jgi:antitoxin component of MazEF toxin-antitoxin module
MNKVVTIQKFIKIGSSTGTTIPAKDFKYLGAKHGDDVKVTYELLPKPEDHTEEVVSLTQKLIKRHQEALDNLSQR